MRTPAPVLFAVAIACTPPQATDSRTVETGVDTVDTFEPADTSQAETGDTGDTQVLEPPYDQELLINGSFETGELTPWQVEFGGCTVLASTKQVTSPDGDWHLEGGAGGDCLTTQSIDLLAVGFQAADIDAGRLSWSSSVIHRKELAPGTYETFDFDDRGWMRMRFEAEGGTVLSTARSLGAGDKAWQTRTADGLLPPGTRVVTVQLESELRRGGYLDAASDAASFRVQETDPDVPSFLQLPVLHDMRGDGMSFLWVTDANLATHSVKLAETGGALQEVETVVESIRIDSGRYAHKAVVSGLAPETPYDYEVVSGDTSTATLGFRTAPLQDSPWRMGWMADNQLGAFVFPNLISLLSQRAPDLLMVVGDIVQEGELQNDWTQDWFVPLGTDDFAHQVPVMIARGNHDGEYPLAYAYTLLPDNEAWYAFPYGNAYVIVLDSEAPTDGAQLDWLEQQLDSTARASAEFTIVAFHRTPYSNTRDPDAMQFLESAQRHWTPVFEAAGVDLVICGHHHSYQRGELNGVTWLVIGGATPLLDVGDFDTDPFLTVVHKVNHYGLLEGSPGALRWTAWDSADVELDSFTLTP